MAKEILKRLLYSLLFTTIISTGISWMNYQSTQNLEARQVNFIFVVIAFFLCIFNFILSLTAFLNLKPAVRENNLLSALSFTGLPLAFLVFLVISFFIHKNESEGFYDFIVFAAPSVFYTAALAWHFYRFRKMLKRELL